MNVLTFITIATSILPVYLVPDTEFWTSCNSLKTCTECLNFTGCHFCASDYQCHAMGAGCLVGIACHNISECVRPTPEHIGYGFPSFAAFAGSLVIILSFILCLCTCSLGCSVYRKCCRTKTFKSTRCNTCGRKALAKHQCDASELHSVDTQALLDGASETPDFNESVSPESLAQKIRRQRLEPAKRSKRMLFCWGILGLFCIIIAVVFLVFFPKNPDYNICNRSFEWGSILHSITRMTSEVDYQVAISVKNMNRLGFTVERANATIYHRGIPVGAWNLSHEWTAEAGAISDILIEIVLTPGIGKEALDLLSDFRANKLFFRIDASLYGAITSNGYKIYRMSTVLQDIEFRVGEDTDRSLCPKGCTYD